MAKNAKNPQLIKKSFEKWHHQDLEAFFNLKRIKLHPVMAELEASQNPIPKEIADLLEQLRQELILEVIDWNEKELLTKFISPFLYFVHFSGEKFKSFAERPIKALIGNYELSGTVDWLVAGGTYQPQAPYFFLHEYKRFKGTESDPLGQLLSAMLAANVKNGDKEPLFGCFIVGNNWYFTILDGLNYYVHEGYNVSSANDFKQVWSILIEIKRRIAIRAVA